MRTLPWRVSTVLLLTVAVACSGPNEIADWTEAFDYTPDEVHTFDIGEFGYPYVPVVLAGQTHWLVFDTGNMVGLSVSPEVFQASALPCDEAWERLNSAGEPVSSGCVAHRQEAGILGTAWPELSIYEWQQPPLAGLVGPDHLPGDRFTMDYRRREMAVRRRPLDQSIPGFESLPLVRSPRHPRLVLVVGSIQGREVLVELDTGKSRGTVDRALVRELALDTSERGALVGTVSLGSHTLEIGWAREVDTGGISDGLPSPILLGMGSDVLSGFVWTVDYESGMLWLPRENRDRKAP
jgi:hypothetical protein